MPPISKPSEDEWLQKKAYIRQRYLVDSASLKQLIVDLGNIGLSVTKAQLEYKLKQWRFQKNIDKATWIELDRRIAKRKREGKNSQVIHCGKRMKQSTVERETNRHRDISIFARFAPASSPPPTSHADTQLVVLTPPAYSTEFMWPTTLPWLRFQANHFQLISNLRQTNIPAAGSAGPLCSAHHESLISALLRTESHFLSRNSQQTLAKLADAFGVSMPECHPGEHLQRAYCILNGPTEESLLECLKTLVYRISNNLSVLYNVNEWTATIAILREQGMLDLKVDFTSLQDATINVFMENMFKAAIFFAIREGNYTRSTKSAIDSFVVLKWLLSSGQSPDIGITWPFDDTPITPLGISISAGNLQLAKCLLDAGADANLVLPGSSAIPSLDLALQCNPIALGWELAILLLQYGATPNMDKMLQCAVRKNDKKLVAEILDQGANLLGVLEPQSCCLQCDETALSVAAATGLPETELVLAFLAAQYPSNSMANFLTADVLIAAAARANDDVILHLYGISGNSSPDNHSLVNRIGITPLHVASWKGNLSTCQLLVSLHCPHSSNFLDISPLHLACYHAEKDVVRFLIEIGVDVNLTATLSSVVKERLGFSAGLVATTPLEMLSRQIESTPPPQRRLTCATLLICAGARLSGGEVVLAVENLHFDLLSATLVAGGSPNEKDKYGRSALHLALRKYLWTKPENGAIFSIVTQLLEYGAMLLGGETVTAIASGDWNLVSLLLKYGGSLLETDTNGTTALEAAIQSGNSAVLNKLLEVPFDYDEGSLCAAVIAEEDDLINMILARRPTQAKPTVLEMTAIGLAAESCDIGLLRQLLTYIPYAEAAKIALLPIISFQDPACYGEDPEVASYRHKDDYGVSFWRIANQTKGSPLTFCAMANATEACRELLQRGFCPDKLTWVIISAENDQSMAQILIDNGQKLGDNLNNPLIPTQNPLLGAITHRNKDLVLLLLQAGVEINENDETIRYNRSPLQLAAELGDLDIADCLLKAGADVNGAPARYHGGTALQLAAAQAHIGLAKHLIESGADVNAPPSKYRGRTALEAAAEHGRLDMVDLLLSHGVLTTGKGQHHYIRSVQLALSEGHNTVAHILKKCRDWSEEDDRLFEIQDPEDYSEDGSEDGSEGDREYEHGNAGESDMAAFLGFEHRNAANEGNVGELDMTAFFDFPAAGDEIMTNSS